MLWFYNYRKYFEVLLVSLTGELVNFLSTTSLLRLLYWGLAFSKKILEKLYFKTSTPFLEKGVCN